MLKASHLSSFFLKRHVLLNVCGNFGKREGRFSTSYSNTQGDGDYDDDANFCKFQAGLEKQWKDLLALAVSMERRSATNWIWTCGLTDGGIHNLFLDDNEDDDDAGEKEDGKTQLWMFDLGEPGLMPVPAFLTKFLMSYLHTLGMEEDKNGEWIVRFEQNENDDDDKLRLTKRTKELLPRVMKASDFTMDRFAMELFDNDAKVREGRRCAETTKRKTTTAFDEQTADEPGINSDS